MAQSLSAKRLRKELLALTRDPVENITARPLESNILVWHYVLKGGWVKEGASCLCVHVRVGMHSARTSLNRPTRRPLTTPGAKGSPYEGGYYHGKLKFPPEYPLKPPSILMLTPSGRFKPNTRLCLSMSDFHPETWNPM